MIGDLHFHSTLSDGNKTPEERITQIEHLDPEHRGFWALTDDDRFGEDFTESARDRGIRAVLATEISTHSNELDLSFHVTCYAPQYSEAIATRIRRVIEGKKEKVQKQIQKLQQKGFHISTSDFFSWIGGQRMSPESVSNGHLAYFIWKNKENRDLANDYTHGKIPRNTSEESQVIFMKECLRENGDYRNIGYVGVPQYEPELSELVTIAKKEDLTLCIAHPNFSFSKKLQKEHGALHQKDQALAFEKHIVSKLSDIGIRNYELNSLASKPWAEILQKTYERVGGILLPASDNHGLERADSKHGILGKHSEFFTPDMARKMQQRFHSFV